MYKKLKSLPSTLAQGPTLLPLSQFFVQLYTLAEENLLHILAPVKDLAPSTCEQVSKE